jgi:2TM domain
MGTNASNLMSLAGVAEAPEQARESTTAWMPPNGPASATISRLPGPQAPSSFRHDERAEAQRWVRRKRILYTILGIYAVLSLMWFAIDMADGAESLWFYWPMMGTGVAVAVTAIVLLGVGGVFGVDWERRQVEWYLRRHR